jgi:hypothetical protein
LLQSHIAPREITRAAPDTRRKNHAHNLQRQKTEVSE